MATQRGVWSCWDTPAEAHPALDIALPLARVTLGLVLPAFLILGFGTAVSDGKILCESGRHLGAFNYHCLAGPSCILFGIGGLLASIAVGLWAWCIGRSSDCRRDGLNYTLGVAAGLCFFASLTLDAFIRA